MISALISRLVILVFGLLYPAYSSYKAVKTKDIKLYVKWMMYWIVFALFTAAETFTDIFFGFWFPFYYELKVIIVVWLLSPMTRGSSIMYRRVIHPLFMKREQEIDELIARAKDQGYNVILDIGCKGMSLATNAIMSTAVKGSSGLLFQLKKSYSLNDLIGDDRCTSIKMDKRTSKLHDCTDDFSAHDQLSHTHSQKKTINEKLKHKDANLRSSCYERSSMSRNASLENIFPTTDCPNGIQNLGPRRSARQDLPMRVVSQKSVPPYTAPSFLRSSNLSHKYNSRIKSSCSLNFSRQRVYTIKKFKGEDDSAKSQVCLKKPNSTPEIYLNGVLIDCTSSDNVAISSGSAINNAFPGDSRKNRRKRLAPKPPTKFDEERTTSKRTSESKIFVDAVGLSHQSVESLVEGRLLRSKMRRLLTKSKIFVKRWKHRERTDVQWDGLRVSSDDTCSSVSTTSSYSNINE